MNPLDPTSNRQSGEGGHIDPTGSAVRVSVVIPTARGGPYLREAVGSVLCQSFEDFELIVIADGCAEDLSDLELLDRRLRVVRQVARGVSVARNVGVRAARSELIAFLDDDDRMLPGRLAAQYDAMRNDPEVAICHTQFRFIDGAGAPGEDGYSRSVEYHDLLRGELGVLMPATMMRKSLLQQVGLFDATLRTCEDVDMILRLASRSRLVFLPSVLTEYRRHASNASRDTRLAGLTLESVIAKHLTFAQLTGDTRAAFAAEVGIRRMRKLASAGSIVHGREAWRQGKWFAALRLIIEAAHRSPSGTLRDIVGNRRVLKRARAAAARYFPGERRPAMKR